MHPVSQTNVHLFIFWITLSKLTDFNNFGMLNPEKIWHEHFTDLSTSPVRCSHFTLGNPKSHFGAQVSEQKGCVGSICPPLVSGTRRSFSCSTVKISGVKREVVGGSGVNVSGSMSAGCRHVRDVRTLKPCSGPDLSVWRPWAGSLLEARTHSRML